MSMMRTQELPNWAATNGKISRPISSTAILVYAWRGLFWTSKLRSAIRFLCVSGAVGHTFAHDAGRPDREHDNQDHEGEDVLVVAAEEAAGQVADIAGAQAVDDAEQDAADHRAVD